MGEAGQLTFNAVAGSVHSHAVLAVLDGLDDAVVHNGQARCQPSHKPDVATCRHRGWFNT